MHLKISQGILPIIPVDVSTWVILGISSGGCTENPSDISPGIFWGISFWFSPGFFILFS